MYAKSAMLIQQLQDRKNQPLLLRCADMLQEMQEQLQKALKINEEQKQLIEILKEGKEYYQNEYKNNMYEAQFINLQQRNNRLTALLEGHRSTIIELKRHSQQLQQTIATSRATIQQQKSIIKQHQQKEVTLTLEKQLLQRQWDKVVKAVKRKITKIVQQDHCNYEQVRTKKTQKSLQKTSQKQNNDPVNLHYTHRKKQNPETDMSLQDRAHQMIKIINDRLAIQQLEGLFETPSSAKKQTGQKIKGIREVSRDILRELDMNEQRQPLT